MKRCIKFRFWNKIAKKFQRPERYAIDGSGHLIAYDYEMHQYDDPVHFEKTIIVAQQFTSMKDKEGREIYEGDIIRAFNGGDYVVTSDGGCFCARNIAAPQKCCCLRDLEKVELSEIIGNVFENPKFLSDYAKSFLN